MAGNHDFVLLLALFPMHLVSVVYVNCELFKFHNSSCSSFWFQILIIAESNFIQQLVNNLSNNMIYFGPTYPM